MQTIKLGQTAYFHFAVNDTAGSGADGASAAWDVRLAGDGASSVPILSGSATLLTHANYPDGCYEIAIAATEGNGFAVEEEYAVFTTIAVSTTNPTGFAGSFKIPAQVGPVTTHFNNANSNGFSAVQTVSGSYILHVSGTFAGATITLLGGLVGQNPASFSTLRSFNAEQKRVFTYVGDVRFAISGATGSTELTVILQEII
jgi:hypothetical protein